MTSYCNQTVTVVKNNDCCSPTKHTEKYSVTLTVSDTWIMPDVTETTVLTIPNCNNILPGSWLWNPNVGYLEVVKYNFTTGETVVKNIGYDGNARPGTVFPSCMDFTVTGPIYIDTISDDVTCLEADFVSPEVGSCALMRVKSTANLKKDYIIAIEIYQYRVDAVIDNNTVRVCNYGLGKVGTIDAPCDGSCLPVRVINANSPCLQDDVNAADAIVVCVGGESKLLVGNEEGQIANWSNGSGEWQLINSNIEIDCTVTTNFVNITAGNAGPYLLNVKTTAPFKVGDRITFNGEHDAYKVTQIVSATQLRLLRNTAPTTNYIIDTGARLCIVDCCDWLPAVVENLAARVTDVENKNNAQDQRLDNLEDDVEDLENTKQDKLPWGSIISGTPEILDVANGVNVLINHNSTLTVDTDLSKYDNTNKHFVIDGNNVGSSGSVGVFKDHTDDNTTGDRTLNFRSIKSGDTTKLSVVQQGNDIIINNLLNPPAANLEHYSYVYSFDFDLPNITTNTKWTTYGTYTEGDYSLSITNPYDRPLNLFVSARLRTSFQLGTFDGVPTEDDPTPIPTTYDGWVDLENTIEVYQTDPGQPEYSFITAKVSSVTSMEVQESYNTYHYVNNTFPILHRDGVSIIPANTTSIIRGYAKVKKDNNALNGTPAGGRLRWINAPHMNVRILAVVD